MRVLLSAEHVELGWSIQRIAVGGSEPRGGQRVIRSQIAAPRRRTQREHERDDQQPGGEDEQESHGALRGRWASFMGKSIIIMRNMLGETRSAGVRRREQGSRAAADGKRLKRRCIP